MRRSLLNLKRRPGERPGGAIPVVLLMIIALLAMPAAPVLVLAAQEGEPPPTQEPAFQPVDEPTAEVLPTDEPAPTDVPPTETPTVTPTTTPTMTPTLEPTDEPTPTSTMTPEPSATATPSPTSTETLTATATPSPSPRARIAAASVSSGSGRISGCTLGGASDQLQPGQTLTTTCFYTRSLFEDGVEFQLQAPTSSLPGMANGWQVQLNANGVSTGWVSGPTTVRVAAGLFTSGFSFTYALRAPANAVATGSMVASTVSVYPCLILCSGGQSGSLTLSAGIAPLTADDMGMSCAPASPLSVPRAGSATFTCKVNALSGLNTSSLIVRSVKIPAAPTGWAVKTSPAGATGSDGSTTISPEQTLAAGGSWSFTVTLTPSCLAGATATWVITSQVANTNGTVTGPNVAGPSTSYTANATGTTQTMSASVVSSSLSWAVAYSFTEQTTSGALTYRVTGAGCAGWNVSVKAQPFTYTGTAEGTVIPANNLALTSIGAPTVVAGSVSGVSPVNSVGGLGTPRTVLRSTAGSGAGTYEQQLGVSLTVPGGATVGSYRSTITITAASGP